MPFFTGTYEISVFANSALAYVFVVEDGTGKLDAKSYLAVAEANAILKSHPDAAIWFNKTLAQKQAALINATRYLDRRYRWYSRVRTTHQALGWPRQKMINAQNVVINAGVMPAELKEACAIIALQWTQDNLWSGVAEEGVIKSFSVGPLAITYDTAAEGVSGAYGKAFPDVDLLLNSYGQRKGSDYVDNPQYDGVS